MPDSVIITKVKNGWIVQMPLPLRQFYGPMPAPDYEQQLRKQARIMREEFQKDDELARLRGETADDNQEQLPPVASEKLPEAGHLFIFTDAEKMLAFLSERLIKN